MAEILTPEQLEAFKRKLEQMAARAIAEAQANVDWFKQTTGATLTRTQNGVIRAAVYSPITGREVIVRIFGIDKTADRHFLETEVANIQPRVLEVFAEDYIHEKLISSLRL